MRKSQVPTHISTCVGEKGVVLCIISILRVANRRTVSAWLASCGWHNNARCGEGRTVRPSVAKRGHEVTWIPFRCPVHGWMWGVRGFALTVPNRPRVALTHTTASHTCLASPTCLSHGEDAHRGGEDSSQVGGMRMVDPARLRTGSVPLLPPRKMFHMLGCLPRCDLDDRSNRCTHTQNPQNPLARCVCCRASREN